MSVVWAAAWAECWLLSVMCRAAEVAYAACSPI